MSKPIVIFRHSASEGPGYLAQFLDEHALPWRLVAIDAGEPVPASAEEFSGLVFMGGPMSVNDDLPWIPQVLSLIREAVDKDIPVLGHCLGGQLMSKALGGTVGRTPVKEIGWVPVRTLGTAAAEWFGPDTRDFQSFHWHGETFTIPAGAERVLESDYCANQAFAFGKHLGFQCHVEMTADMIRDWCVVGADDLEQAKDSPGVQSAEAMQRDIETHLEPMRRIARHAYTRWIQGLKR